MRDILTAVLAVAILSVVGILAWRLKSLDDELTAMHRELAHVRMELSHLQGRTTSSSQVGAHGQPTSSAQSSLHESQQVAVRVDGLNYAFAPLRILVKVGATVTWVNATMAPHTVTSFQRGLFDRSLSPRKSAALVFRKPGTYHYYCSYHPYMRGVVIVHP